MCPISTIGISHLLTSVSHGLTTIGALQQLIFIFVFFKHNNNETTHEKINKSNECGELSGRQDEEEILSTAVISAASGRWLFFFFTE